MTLVTKTISAVHLLYPCLGLAL